VSEHAVPRDLLVELLIAAEEAGEFLEETYELPSRVRAAGQAVRAATGLRP
jgi:hypothetical protein